MKTASLILLLAALSAGCGGSSHHAAIPTRQTTTTARGDATSAQAMLTRAVRAAVRQNFRLSLYVLWHNQVPGWATHSTRGPALAGLRASAATRRKRGIRIRPVKTTLRIVTIRIDPSYTRATAIAESRQRVRPYEAGSPKGHDISLNEKARFTLRRLGNAQRFVVWEVTLRR